MANREFIFSDIKERFGFTDSDFIHALENCPPGFFRAESMWDYWNWKLNIRPPLPYPRPGSLENLQGVFTG
jgi:hypothetical protein